jgi:hypothetical protein
VFGLFDSKMLKPITKRGKIVTPQEVEETDE